MLRRERDWVIFWFLAFSASRCCCFCFCFCSRLCWPDCFWLVFSFESWLLELESSDELDELELLLELESSLDDEDDDELLDEELELLEDEDEDELLDEELE